MQAMLDGLADGVSVGPAPVIHYAPEGRPVCGVGYWYSCSCMADAVTCPTCRRMLAEAMLVTPEDIARGMRGGLD